MILNNFLKTIDEYLLRTQFPIVRNVALVFLVFQMLSCGPSSSQQAAIKKAEEERLADSADNTPDKLIQRLNQQLIDEDFDAVRNSIAELKKRHPDSPETQKADSIGFAMEEMIADRQKQYEEALASMRAETDEMTGVTWYRDRSSPQYVNRNGFYLKFNSNGYLFLAIQYYGDEWLFIDHYSIKADEKVYTITPDDVERDNDADVWEWYNMVVQESDCQMIKNIANAEQVTIRMSGSQYYKDVKLSNTQLTAFKNALHAYWGAGHKTCY